jgi:hypothetical protein
MELPDRPEVHADVRAQLDAGPDCSCAIQRFAEKFDVRGEEIVAAVAPDIILAELTRPKFLLRRGKATLGHPATFSMAANRRSAAAQSSGVSMSWTRQLGSSTKLLRGPKIGRSSSQAWGVPQ